MKAHFSPAEREFRDALLAHWRAAVARGVRTAEQVAAMRLLITPELCSEALASNAKPADIAPLSQHPDPRPVALRLVRRVDLLPADPGREPGAGDDGLSALRAVPAHAADDPVYFTGNDFPAPALRALRTEGPLPLQSYHDISAGRQPGRLPGITREQVISFLEVVERNIISCLTGVRDGSVPPVPTVQGGLQFDLDFFLRSIAGDAFQCGVEYAFLALYPLKDVASTGRKRRAVSHRTGAKMHAEAEEETAKVRKRFAARWRAETAKGERPKKSALVKELADYFNRAESLIWRDIKGLPADDR